MGGLCLLRTLRLALRLVKRFDVRSERKIRRLERLRRREDLNLRGLLTGLPH